MTPTEWDVVRSIERLIGRPLDHQESGASQTHEAPRARLADSGPRYQGSALRTQGSGSESQGRGHGRGSGNGSATPRRAPNGPDREPVHGHARGHDRIDGNQPGTAASRTNARTRTAARAPAGSGGEMRWIPAPSRPVLKEVKGLKEQGLKEQRHGLNEKKGALQRVLSRLTAPLLH